MKKREKLLNGMTFVELFDECKRHRRRARRSRIVYRTALALGLFNVAVAVYLAARMPEQPQLLVGVLDSASGQSAWYLCHDGPCMQGLLKEASQ